MVDRRLIFLKLAQSLIVPGAKWEETNFLRFIH